MNTQGEKMASSNIVVRIDNTKKERFLKIAKQNDDTASQLIRKYIDKYLSEHSQGKLC